MNIKNTTNLIQILNSDNACLIHSKNSVDFSKFKEKHKDYKFLIFEVNSISIVNLNDLTTTLYLEVLNSISNTIEFKLYSDFINETEQYIMNITSSSKLNYELLIFEFLLSQIYSICKEIKCKPIIIFHDINEIFERDQKTIWKLRAILQHSKFLNYVGTTRSDNTFTISRESPFYKNFEILEIDNEIFFDMKSSLKLSLPELNKNTTDYIIYKLNSDPINIELFINLLNKNYKVDSFLNFPLDRTIAYIISKIYNILENKHRERLRELSKIKHGIFVYKNLYFKRNYEYNVLQQSMLNALENNTVNSSNYDRIMRKLEQEDFLIKKSRGKYLAQDVLFEGYVLNRTTDVEIFKEIEAFNSKDSYE